MTAKGGVRHTLYRRLPAVGQLLDDPILGGALKLYGRDSVRVQARREVEALRLAIDGGLDAETVDRQATALPTTIARALADGPGRRLVRVINATGILVHTNLGRVPLPKEVLDEVTSLVTGYCDLEVDLDSGRRSERNRRVAALLRALCGAPAAIVTNNNAAAMVLALATLADGRGVAVSRGELVEIGGSFRIPEILEAAGARLVEVGTTNRTRLDDYRRALDDPDADVALLLKVHPSNYRVVGFTADVEADALAALGRDVDVPVMVDEGSGLLRPDARPQLRDHDSLATLIDAGIDLVSGSGDKVLGGPQAGLLAGRADLVERCRRHPLYRAVRPDGFTFGSLEAVLRRHLAGEPMPLDRLWDDSPSLRRRLAELAERIGGEVTEADGYIGGGSAPDHGVLGPVLVLPAGSDTLFEPLRRGAGDAPPVVGYARDGRLHLDLRTVEPDDDRWIDVAIRHATEGTTP
ncbi:MAG: L-seryl-tRNA(Sec) selenium transferase [Acidobacteriota bacterium]